MIVLTEGQVCARSASKISYPQINSCLTITCVCEHNMFAGGHGVIFPDAEKGQKSIDPIIAHILLASPIQERGHLFLIGDIDSWNSSLPHMNSQYRSVAAIAESFKGCQSTIIEIEGYTRNGKDFVDVYFTPTGRCEIRVHNSNVSHKVINWS